jgi:hypothetical protein
MTEKKETSESAATDLPARVRELHAALADADRDHFAGHALICEVPQEFQN